MSRLRAIPFGCDLIKDIADTILDGPVIDDTITIVLPGKRPSLYLKAHLAARTGGSAFFPPPCFSFEEFIDHIARRRYPAFEDLDGINAVWLIFTLIKTLPVFGGHPFRTKDFGEFLNWGFHLLSFIERLDTEDIDNSVLTHVESNAAIGYDIPSSVNELLANISVLRQEFHAALAGHSWFTRGTKHLAAAEEARNMAGSDPGTVLFAGIFGLTGTEKRIVRSFWDSDRALVIMSGDPEEWPLLKEFVSYLKASAEYEVPPDLKPPVIHLHSGHDVHSEALEAYRIIREDVHSRGAIILPAPDSLFPVLNLVVDRIDVPCNISLGHPIDRTALYTLVRSILDAACERRPDGLYPADLYLSVMLHPFIKNIYPAGNFRNILVHIENIISGNSAVGFLPGRSAVLPDDMEAILMTAENGPCDRESIEALKKVHALLFGNFQNAMTIDSIAVNLEAVLEAILHFTEVRSYVLSGPIFESMFKALQVLRRTLFAGIRLSDNPAKNVRALHDIVLKHLGMADLPFDTHPIEELEILGMLEARNISFERLVVLDVNEGVLPGPRQINPVVPLGVFETLGIPSPEFSEAIYRYNFYRLIGSAQEVHLIFRGSDDKPRSRYIEEIIWKEERRQNKINVMPVQQTVMPVNLKREIFPPVIDKTGPVLSALRTKGFSPSSLDTYVACPLLFYFTRLMGLEERQGFSTDIDASSRGDIIHRILFDTFLPFAGVPLMRERENDVLESLQRALQKHLAEQHNSGEYYLFRNMAQYKLESFIKGHFRDIKEMCIIKYLEQKLSAQFFIDTGPVLLSGKVDRIDCDHAGEKYTVIDYKTGSLSGQYPSKILNKTDFSDIVSIHDHVPSFQLPVYMIIFSSARNIPIENISARLIMLGKNSEESFFKNKQNDNGRLIAAYTDGIRTVISHMLDPNTPFAAFDTKRCMDCRARNLCHV
ncbi:MAG: hypothetical protein H6Q52_369 [Deltaproteobacteria bacterium]|nr:hypothetical protein [Deltaproteobacteria bacterium]